MTTSGDTRALPRIPVPGSVADPLPTVALTIAVAAAEPAPQARRGETTPVAVADETPAVAPAPALAPAPAPALAPAPAPAGAPAAESHERIYEEAMATIAALASSWCSAVQRTSGRHRAAA